jgi:hypothetical protein
MPFFAKTKDRKIKQVLSGDGTIGRRGGYKESVLEVKFSVNIMYSYMKMEKRNIFNLL